jgi:3-oxoacyl-[acyl-carrier protein] reductase
MKINLEGRVALVTGGSRGIGFAIAQKLAESGAHIVLNARTKSASLETAVKSIEDFGVSVQTCIGDVGDVETAKAASKIAFSSHRRLDILVNNAGILDDGLIGMISEEAINNTLQTNVAGVFHFTQACARLMARNGGGSIINISSIIGRFGNKGQMVYGASKAAVIGATLSSAKELAPQNIRVNAIAPGYINTDMIKGIEPKIDTERRESIGMKRIGTADDVALTALYLSSDMSAYVTGQVIGVDGSMVI